MQQSVTMRPNYKGFYENCFVGFEIFVEFENESHVIGFTIYNSNSEAIISSTSGDSNIKLIFGNNTLYSKIPCGLFIPANYYLEYNYNGKNVESALQIKKSLSKSSFLVKGGNPKADLVAYNWLGKQTD